MRHKRAKRPQQQEITDHFMLDAAHELRTPLTALRTTLELLHANDSTTITEYQSATALVEQRLKQLEQLIEDMLLLASATQLQLGNDVALGPLLEEVLGNLTPLAEKHGVLLLTQGDADVTVPSDGSLLMRAFANLIENGIRYNHPGGQVVVILERSANDAFVQVVDGGIGMTPEEQMHIFDRFYRSQHAKALHTRGTGLGLAIVAHIIRQHGGDLRVESTPGEGSRFIVRLPLQPLTPILQTPCYAPPIRRPKQRAQAKQDSTRRSTMTTRLLIIDDAPDMRQLIGQLFRQKGFEPLTAANGTIGLDLARREQPHIIILDLGLPDIDGLEVCRQLRAESSIPIVMLTKRALEQDRIAGLQAGADDYITKPFSGEELVLRVQAVLRRIGR